jgi:hypothetical protein
LPAQKTFGETFGAATGVSAPRLQGRLCRGFSFASRIFSHAEARRARREKDWIFSASPRLRVNRCIPLLQTFRFFTVAEGSRLLAAFFLTRSRGERGGKKIGFSPRAPRLRVNRCIPLLQTSRFFTVAEGSRLPAGFFLTRRRGERGGRKIGFSPRAPRLRVNRCIPLLHSTSGTA